MRSLALAILVALTVLASPVAGAWPAEIRAPIDGGLGVRTSLLVAGAIDARAPAATVLGAGLLEELRFGDGATIDMCPDQAGRAVEGSCADNETMHDAHVSFRDAGFVARSVDGAAATLAAPAAVAALGGSNLTIGQMQVGGGVFAGGPLALHADGTTFSVRVLGSNASIIVGGREGVRYYEGTGFTLRVTNATTLDSFDARGGFLAMPKGATVRVTRAGVGPAERFLSLEALHDLMRRVVPPEQLERRADLVDAFGPFQVVPALLDGAVSARVNLTVNGRATPEDGLVLRVTDASLATGDGAWEGAANASYVVQGDAIAPQLGSAPSMPWWLVVPLVLAAVVARVRTRRALAPRGRRWLAGALALVGAVALLVAAVLSDASTLGVSVLRDGAQLAWRSRVELALLAGGVVLVAYLLVGLPAASLVRSWRAWRGHPEARLVPLAVGVAVTLGALLLWRAALIAVVAKVVRL